MSKDFAADYVDVAERIAIFREKFPDGSLQPADSGAVGDGLCLATTYSGMASGGIPARTMLLCAYSTADLIGHSEPGKLRVRRAHVVQVLDGEQVLREHGSGADLSGADLSGAYLSRAIGYTAAVAS